MQIISLVMPAYNERRTIKQILEKVIAFDSLGFHKEIVVINDASKDDTAQIVLDLQKSLAVKVEQLGQESKASWKAKDGSTITLRLFTNNPNKGKSGSVIRGIAATVGDIVVIQDADLEYDPAELTEFLRLFKQDPELQAVYGNRFARDNKVVYWQNWFGNRFLTFVSNLFTMWRGVRVGDMEVCYKMVKGDLMRKIGKKLRSKSSFGFEPEVTALLSKVKGGLKYQQVPISYYPRTIAEGKHMSAFKDGIKALWEIVKYNLG